MAHPRWTPTHKHSLPGSRNRVAGGRTSVSAPLDKHPKRPVPLGREKTWISNPNVPATENPPPQGANTRVAGGRTSVSVPLNKNPKIGVLMGSQEPWIEPKSPLRPHPKEHSRRPVAGPFGRVFAVGCTLEWPIPVSWLPGGTIRFWSTSSGAESGKLTCPLQSGPTETFRRWALAGGWIPGALVGR